MKSSIPNALSEVREDLSDYLWHFCREDDSPEAVLSAILHDMKILSSRDWMTGANVVCFTEMPLEQVKKQMPVLREHEYTRFSSYGLGLPKELIFQEGGLPVIYQPRVQLEEFPEYLKWRHVNFDLTAVDEIDFSWQREWRMKGHLNFSNFRDQVIVVVPDEGAFEGIIYEIEEDGDYDDGETVSFPSYTRVWKSVSLDWIEAPITNKLIRTIQSQ